MLSNLPSVHVFHQISGANADEGGGGVQNLGKQADVILERSSM